jgi:hypothetical protein
MVMVNQVPFNPSSISRKGKGGLVRGKKPTIILIVSLHSFPEFTASLTKFFQNLGRDTTMGRRELISVFNESIQDKILRYFLT